MDDARALKLAKALKLVVKAEGQHLPPAEDACTGTSFPLSHQPLRLLSPRSSLCS